MAETVFFGETDAQEFVLSPAEATQFQSIVEGLGPMSVAGTAEFDITAGPDDEKDEDEKERDENEKTGREGEGPWRAK